MVELDSQYCIVLYCYFFDYGYLHMVELDSQYCFTLHCIALHCIVLYCIFLAMVTYD